MTPVEKFEYKVRWTREGEYHQVATYNYYDNLEICKRLFQDLSFRAFKHYAPDDSHLFIFHDKDDFDKFISEGLEVISHD